MKSSFTHQLGDAYRKAVSIFAPVETKSQFEAKGTLTVQEFIEAGDALVFKFPTWQWAPAANKKSQKDYLPADKQFLVTRHVPCLQRVADLDRNHTTLTVDGDCWMVAGSADDGGHQQPAAASTEKAPAVAVQLVENYTATTPVGGFAQLDKELLTGGDEEEETNTVVRRVQQDEDKDERNRSYDLSITWDKFYQTPRLWLRGFSASGEPLTERQVREDVLGEYASKTVTMEPHPATGELTASIHPCKHAEMMKRVIQTWKEKNIPVRSDLSLFVFLKFISGVVPTINYDFTFDLEMNS